MSLLTFVDARETWTALYMKRHKNGSIEREELMYSYKYAKILHKKKANVKDPSSYQLRF